LVKPFDLCFDLLVKPFDLCFDLLVKPFFVCVVVHMHECDHIIQVLSSLLCLCVYDDSS